MQINPSSSDSSVNVTETILLHFKFNKENFQLFLSLIP